MKSSPSYRSLKSGFSLVAASILLTVGALVFVSFLPGDNAGDYNDKIIDNHHKMEKIDEAMRSFMTLNGRRPCPADGQYPVNNANFGVEASNPGSCIGGAIVAPLGPDTSGNLVGGTIPTRAIGLPDDFAFDSFGRHFTYIVDIRATSNSACLALTTGGLTIKSSTGGTTLDTVMYSYISFGKSGYGAWPGQGSASVLTTAQSVASRINSGSTDADMETNAQVNASFVYTSGGAGTFTTTLVQKPKTTTFDDTVFYRKDLKNTCALGTLAKKGTPGFRIDGTATYPNVGMAIAVGDVNGDNIPDLIIGANNNGTADNGNLIVVFGTASGFPDPLPVSSLNGTNGFILTYATAGDALGTNVAVGNFSSNSHADILVGALKASYSAANSGSAYVIYGGSTMKSGTAWSTCPCSLTAGGSVINGTNGFRIDGAAASDNLGGNEKTLQFADVNGDGNLDIILGVPTEASNGAASGSVWVIYGNGAGKMKDGTSFAQTQTLALATKPIDGTNGYRLDGATAGDWFGYSFAVADFNGDGKNDLIIGAEAAGYNALASSGSAYVIYGTGANLMPSGTITTANSSAAATVGSFAGLEVGMYINTPKTAGLYISACGGSTTCSSTSITLSGNATGAQAAVAYTVDAARVTSTGTLIDGTHGFRLDGATASDRFGGGVVAGDFNGDGKADLLIGLGTAGSYNGLANSGSVYVVYGGAAGKFYDNTALAATQKVTSASKPIDGTNGFRLDGPDASDYLGGGNDMLAIADVNGDGKNDIIIGDKNAAFNALAASGSVYVILGNGSGAMKDGTAFAATQIISSGSKPIDGTNGFRLDGRQASDMVGEGTAGSCVADVNNDGKNDLIIGASHGNTAGANGSVYVLYGSYVSSIHTSTYGLSNLCTGGGC